MRQNNYHPELTVFSGLAILFVVSIHASASALTSFYPSASGYEGAGAALRSFFNLVAPSVPMFIFASGSKFALHDRETPYLTFLKKRLPRVLMSFFLINTLFWALDSLVWMERFDPVLLLKTYIVSWLGYTVAYPLWYIPMYCFVILLCPLLRHLIHSSRIRLLCYFLMGSAQILGADVLPMLSKMPFTFLSYPLFFELGSMVTERNFKVHIPQRFPLIALYAPLIIAVSYVSPSLSRSPLYCYLAMDLVGTLVYYQLSVLLSQSRLLFWLGTISYPIFLLHEPIIGRLTTNLLQNLHLTVVSIYLSLWIIIVLLATTVFIYLLKRLHLNRIIWEFGL